MYFQFVRITADLIALFTGEIFGRTMRFHVSTQSAEVLKGSITGLTVQLVRCIPGINDI